MYHSKNKESIDNKTSENQLKNLGDVDSVNLKIANKDINKVKETISGLLRYETQGNNTPIILETKKEYKRKNKDKYNNKIKDISSDITEEESQNNQILYFIDGEAEIQLGEGESIVRQWAL